MTGSLDTRFWDRLAADNFGPGWAKPTPSLWPQPRRDYRVTRFAYPSARQALEEATPHVSTEQAERRNLICVNPLEGNTYATTANLVAAFQLVAPGERARSHRHSPNALRVVLDCPKDTYTIVDGVRVDMAPGDVVLTPNWRWHGHANDGAENALWVDILDVPFIQHTGPMFFEPHPDGIQAVTAVEPSSTLRIRPDQVLGGPHAGPLEVIDVAVGVMPTIGIQLIGMSNGELGPVRTTANRLYVVIDGQVDVDIENGAEQFRLERGDVLAVPSWNTHRMESTGSARIVCVSDAPLMEALGLLRSGSGDE